MKDYLKSFTGVLLLTLGINLMLKANIAISPFDTLCLLYSIVLDIEFGLAALAVYMTFFLFSLYFLYLKRLSFKHLLFTILGSLLVSILIALIGHLLTFNIDNNVFRIIIYLIGYLVYVAGVTHVIKYNIIMTPFDKFQKCISQTYNIKAGNVRIVVDIIIIIIAFIAKYILGITLTFGIITIILMLTTGPLINIFYKKV